MAFQPAEKLYENMAPEHPDDKKKKVYWWSTLPRYEMFVDDVPIMQRATRIIDSVTITQYPNHGLIWFDDTTSP